MRLRADSPAGQRFYAALREGRGLKASARIAGIDKGIAFRFLREAFVALRDEGLSAEQAQQRLGFTSSLMPAWDAARVHRDGRHHLRHTTATEEAFWAAFDAGALPSAAATTAGISRASAYRWLAARYIDLRTQHQTPTTVAAHLRLTATCAASYERAYQQAHRARLARQYDHAARLHAQRQQALADAAALVVHQRLLPGVKDLSAQRARQAARREQYWTLMRQGLTNAAACRILGVSRRLGTAIRTADAHQTVSAGRPTPAVTPPPADGPGRYLQLHERLLIADLLALGESIRAIAAHLGRAPSTISRELSRHRDDAGRYLPHLADHTAHQQRHRPRPTKLAADTRLRTLVQRKLNRWWSPQQIAGWLRVVHPDDPRRWVCTESIYRALLVPGAQVLHQRYTARLRTGRALRRSRFLTRGPRHGVVQNMTMIDQRPAVIDARVQVGHWEGDLIVGAGSASAMITLRERVTHYGVVINLPGDHTSATVTAALTTAFAAMPPGLARSLTWDQGVEMAAHRAFTAASGVPVYFAERSSPWQRGANENFNGLLRQFFPKATDLSVHSDEHVAAVTRELNTRPRKSLGYRTPAACFRRAAKAA